MQWKFYLNSAYDLAGIDQDASAPVVRMTYRSLNNKGEVKDFDDPTLAKQFGQTVRLKNPEDQAKYDEYWAKRIEIEARAHTMWYDDLRQEYSNLNDKTFGIVYSKAYQDAHSSGYDSVYSEFVDLADFANQIIDANRNPPVKRNW